MDNATTVPQENARKGWGPVTKNYDFIEANISKILFALGIFCLFISFVLYVSLQLTKKILRRMNRVNTVVQQ